MLNAIHLCGGLALSYIHGETNIPFYDWKTVIAHNPGNVGMTIPKCCNPLINSKCLQTEKLNAQIFVLIIYCINYDCGTRSIKNMFYGKN